MKRTMIAGLGLPRPVCPGAVRIRIALTALAVTLGVAAVQPAHGAEALRWKFKPGETLRYTMVQELTQESKAMGQQIKTSLHQTNDLHWSVKNVGSDGVTDLSLTIDRIRMKLESPGSSFEFDSLASKDPEGQAASQPLSILRVLVGAELTFKMNGRGELSDIKLPQKLLDTLRQAGPAASAGGTGPEESMKNMISQSSLTLAEGPLENGKSWTAQSKVPSPVGSMLMDKIYTLNGPSPKDSGLLQIAVNTKVSLEPAADSNVAVKILAQKATGEFDFDPQAGRVVSSRVNDKLQLSIAVMGQELEQSTDSVTSMTLVKDGAPK